MLTAILFGGGGFILGSFFGAGVKAWLTKNAQKVESDFDHR